MKQVMKALLIVFLLLGLHVTNSSAKSFSSAKMNYQTYCVQCHGVVGDGHGINTTALEIVPRDHTEKKGMSEIQDKRLFKAIKEGGLSVSKSVLMPAWGKTFTDGEIKELVSYLRQLCNCEFTK